MAKKLPSRSGGGRDTVMIPGEGLVDINRSKALWDSVFTGTKSLAARNGWVDDASVGIPDLYVISGVTLAEALASAGRLPESDSVFKQARGIATLMRREKVFGFDRVQPPSAQPGGDTAARAAARAATGSTGGSAQEVASSKRTALTREHKAQRMMSEALPLCLCATVSGAILLLFGYAVLLPSAMDSSCSQRSAARRCRRRRT
jgi:hypothetical protein